MAHLAPSRAPLLALVALVAWPAACSNTSAEGVVDAGGTADTGTAADATTTDARQGHDARPAIDAPASRDASDGRAPTDAHPATDAGPCGDLSTDPHSCGVCGHDCLGTACVAGLCTPEETAAIPAHHSYFVLDATYVYYGVEETAGATSVAKVLRARKDGSGTPEVLAQALEPVPWIFGDMTVCAGPSAFILNGDLVFLSRAGAGDGGVANAAFAVPTSGGAVRALYAVPQGDGFVCAGGAGNLYVTPSSLNGSASLVAVTVPDGGFPGAGTIPDGGLPEASFPAGGAVTVPDGAAPGVHAVTLLPAGALLLPGALFADPARPVAYVADDFYNQVGTMGPNYLLTVPVANPDASTKVSVGTDVIAAVQGGSAYLEALGTCSAQLSCTGGKIARYSLDAGTSATLGPIAPPGPATQAYSGSYEAYGPPLLADDRSIVWLDGSNLWELPVAGGAPVYLATLGGDSALAMDGSYVYFLSWATGHLVRVAR